MTEAQLINVLVKDGNRSMNWDYPPNKYVCEILNQNGFDPIPGTVKICGQEPPRDIILTLADCPQEPAPGGKQMRVRITFKSVPEKKQSVKKKGVADDVR